MLWLSSSAASQVLSRAAQFDRRSVLPLLILNRSKRLQELPGREILRLERTFQSEVLRGVIFSRIWVGCEGGQVALHEANAVAIVRPCGGVELRTIAIDCSAVRYIRSLQDQDHCGYGHR